jgi:hypothetical protein
LNRFGRRALVGIHENDTLEDLQYCCQRLLACKLWENHSGAPWRHGVKQRALEVLCVSQFTVSMNVRIYIEKKEGFCTGHNLPQFVSFNVDVIALQKINAALWQAYEEASTRL